MKTGDELTITQYDSGWKVSKTIEWKRGKVASRDRAEREFEDVYAQFDSMLSHVQRELESDE